MHREGLPNPDLFLALMEIYLVATFEVWETAWGLVVSDLGGCMLPSKQAREAHIA